MVCEKVKDSLDKSVSAAFGFLLRVSNTRMSLRNFQKVGHCILPSWNKDSTVRNAVLWNTRVCVCVGGGGKGSGTRDLQM